MTMMAQQMPSDDEIQQFMRMAAPKDDPTGMGLPVSEPTQMAPVDPHASLTAPIGPAPPEPMSMSAGSAPTMSASPTPPRMSKIQNQEQQLQSRLNADYAKDNTPSKGFFGHLMGGLDAAVPGVMREFAGTKPFRQSIEEPKLEGRLQTIAKDESTEGLQGAETAGKDEETREAPQKATDAHAQSGAATANLQSETTDRDAATNNPPLATAYAHRVNEVLKAGGDPSTDPIVQHLSDAITSLQPGQNKEPEAPKTISKEIGGKEHTFAFDPATKDYTRDEGLTGTKPQTVNVNTGEKEGQNFFVPDGKGGTKMIRVKPGDAVPAGAQSASGLNSVNTPTTQQRTAAGRAETVVAMAPEVLSRIDALAPKMGPIAGRWNDFMQGKVGSDDPDFAGLRSDLLMMSSAVALAHAQGRLPENLRLEFDHAINAPKQTPANLKATINTMLPWLQKMQGQGQPNGPKGNETTTAPPRPSNVPDGYILRDGPKGRGYYKP